uniref:Uncharacterized protein n=1 Tax=Pseudomonas viridiflava TaxID=33069 RepID=I6LCH6_PSEVI|nr:hypothetical protein [Pseudomonas viridiflava]
MMAFCLDRNISLIIGIYSIHTKIDPRQKGCTEIADIFCPLRIPLQWPPLPACELQFPDCSSDPKPLGPGSSF